MRILNFKVATMTLLRFMLLAFVIALQPVPTAIASVTEAITAAQYLTPVDRYGHFALGRPHEYASITVTTNTGRALMLTLPGNEVFEDITPRIVKLATNEPDELLTIVSRVDSGARLVLIQLRNGALEISAQSSAIGTPMRWLNPVGVADLDGDGRAEIAAVITPHIGGMLKVYRRQGKDLIEFTALSGFSNHLYGSSELALSILIQIKGRTHLLVPDTARRQLRIIALENGRLVEAGRCQLPSPVIGPMRLISPTEVSIGLLAGSKVIVANQCLN